MTIWVPPSPFTAIETNLDGGNPAESPYGTLVASDAVAHTKNATYTELIAALAFDVYAIKIAMGNVGGTNGANSSMLVDIAIGAATAETVIIPNLIAGYASPFNNATPNGGQRYWFPLRIPAGSRLSATAQGAVTSDDVRVAVWLYGKPIRPVWAGETVTAYGIDTGTSRGVTVAAGIQAAEGTYTEITATTARDHPYLAVGAGCDGDLIVIAVLGVLDVGVGAATESTIASTMVLGSGTTETMQHEQMSVWAPVADGSRLAARIAIPGSSAQSYDVAIYGVS